MNGKRAVAQASAATAAARCDDFCGDRHGSLLRRPSADIKADQCVQFDKRGLRYAGLAQRCKAIRVRAPASHDADVAGLRGECDLQKRHVEFYVVCEHDDDRARRNARPAKKLVRP